jgi:hypothetical protein
MNSLQGFFDFWGSLGGRISYFDALASVSYPSMITIIPVPVQALIRF